MKCPISQYESGSGREEWVGGTTYLVTKNPIIETIANNMMTIDMLNNLVIGTISQYEGSKWSKLKCKYSNN